MIPPEPEDLIQDFDDPEVYRDYPDSSPMDVPKDDKSLTDDHREWQRDRFQT